MKFELIAPRRQLSAISRQPPAVQETDGGAMVGTTIEEDVKSASTGMIVGIGVLILLGAVMLSEGGSEDSEEE